MTRRVGETVERWIRWSASGGCLLVAEGLDEHELSALDSALGASRGEVGPAVCSAKLHQHVDGRWRLGIFRAEGFVQEKLADVDEVLPAFARRIGLRCLVGRFLADERDAVWLTGPDASTVARELGARGWHDHGQNALWEPDAEGLLLGDRVFARFWVVRCRRLRGAKRPAIVARCEWDDADTWLGEAAGTVPVSSSQHALRRQLIPLRLSFCVGEDAAGPLGRAFGEHRPSDWQPPASQAKPTVVWLRVGDTRVHLSTLGLDARSEALVRYSIGDLGGDPGPARVFAAVNRSGGRYLWSWIGGPNAFSREELSEVAPLSYRLDSVVQRALLDTDHTHAVFLGSVVQKNDRCIWLVGRRGSGKTSLAIELVFGHGFALLADDFAPWHPGDGCVVPFAKNARLGPGAYPGFGSLRGRGIYLGPTDESPAMWFLNPRQELGYAPPTPGRAGIIVRCLLDPALDAPFSLEPRARDRVLFDLHQDVRLPRGEKKLNEEITSAIMARFDGWTLRYRDRVPAAAALARLAAAAPR